MVFNEAAFLQIPGMLSITHTDTTKTDHFIFDDSYVPPRPASALGDGSLGNEPVPFKETIVHAAETDSGGSPYLSVLMGCSGAAAVIATASALIRRRAARTDEMKGKDMDPVAGKEKDAAKIGKFSGAHDGLGVRLRRSTSNEEMMSDQALGVKTLEVTGGSVKRVAVTFNDCYEHVDQRLESNASLI